MTDRHRVAIRSTGSPEAIRSDASAYLAEARKAIGGKSFLRRIYDEWYRDLATAIPAGDGVVVELGAGGGFLKDILPESVTSDVMPNLYVDVRLDGCSLPFRSGSLRALVMVDVFHHLPDASVFLHEAGRCLRPGGVIAMIEPWVTPWTRLLYGWLGLHHEAFEPGARDWTTAPARGLSGGNNALAWLVFGRDREQFEQVFTELRIDSIVPMMPFRYLLSGGVSHPCIMPGWAFPFWRTLERCCSPLMATLAMFARVVVVRESTPE